MDLFPYEYRPGQRELVEFIGDAVGEGLTAVVEAGTGTGKTVSSLTGALGFTLERGMKVIYLTRTKSQQKQVVRECSAFRSDLVCVAMQGRSAQSCPMMRDDPDLASGNAEEISKLCSEYKKKVDGVCPCRFFANIETTDIDGWVDVMRTQHPGPEDFVEMCEAAEVCPYELTKLILPKADVIAVPYPFVFIPVIYDRFTQWIGVPPSQTVMVVDEAHNLPDYLREVQTSEYTIGALERARKEAVDHGNYEVYQGLMVTDVTDVLSEVIGYAVKEYLIDDDGVLPPYFLEEELMQRLGVSSVGLSKICKAMAEIGDGISEKRKQRRKLPRSYIGSLSRFLTFWMMADEETYVKLIAMEDGRPMLQAYCMDPSGASGPLNQCFSSVHMSGTLEPLDAYIAEIGLEHVVTKNLGAIFPPENLLTVYSDEVTMKYEERDLSRNYDRLMDLLVESIDAVRVNTAVFFPSYGFMDRMVNDGLVERLGRDVFFEDRKMGQSDLMTVFENFRTSEGSVLFCVTGGRISEGLDFPDKSLEMAIVIGIPYPKPTARTRAMRRYYDIRYGNGLAFTSTIPAVRKMRQAIGRVIRSETDRGVAIVMDRRVASLKGMDAMPCDDIPAAVRAFFQ